MHVICPPPILEAHHGLITTIAAKRIVNTPPHSRGIGAERAAAPPSKTKPLKDEEDGGVAGVRLGNFAGVTVPLDAGVPIDDAALPAEGADEAAA
eukprot:CAMPEP_0205942898 /NCGR_PEP_ID=MMETSP1325-20131115/58970_1 /ASSEMBLY_ACC=CAM_ASM_000708 /TAXON_ID=236786 /ORGANISM="Florenciella sp., Strain RCC1007" /LENGTH=94 /DNA_ID=CAMNT_0053313667 /DNA_START=1 /DNA_END=282 /DNA_ORIENTATION=+